MGQPGRKSYFEELQIVKRYAELTPEVFKGLKKFLQSEDKTEQRWAIEQLNKGLIKMIPQKLEGDSDNPIILAFDQSFKHDTARKAKGNSTKSK